MIAAVADTHTAVWYLFGDARLSPAARQAIEEAALAAKQVAVSTITLVELVYLIEKARLHASTLDRLLASMHAADYVFVEAPVDSDVVRAMQAVSRAQVPDLPDRVIAATAVRLRVPLISRDRKIRASSVDVIW